MSFLPAADQLDALRGDGVEIIPEEDLLRKLERSHATGQPLRVKQGFDPTRPDLHIGHAVPLAVLRAFQKLGHEVIFVVGDYTARIGDPTGRNELRPQLSAQQVDENARTYAEQVFRILDPAVTRIEYNSAWLAPLALDDILRLTSHYTVARMLEREDFARRHAGGQSISLVEFMYPLMQGYDSIALRADVELGGSDQRFNLLLARTLQERYGQEPQVCILTPLLRGTDGVQKMSKSYDNYVGIADAPEEQYGRTMSIPDSLLEEWYRMASGLRGGELEQALARAAHAPYEAKRELAARIVARYHGDEAAARAAEHFDRVHRRNEVPEEVPVVRVAPGELDAGAPGQGVPLVRLLVHTGLAPSNSQAARLIEQGAISVDGSRADDRYQTIPARGECLLRKGKRHFVRVVFTPG